MKFIIFSIFLLLSNNGFAFNWKKVVEDRSGDSYYVDVDNIKKNNGLVYYWRLEDFLEPKYGDYSFIRKFKVDCVKEKRTWLSDTFYNQPMGKGKITDEQFPNKISYPKPNSIGYVVMKFACNY